LKQQREHSIHHTEDRCKPNARITPTARISDHPGGHINASSKHAVPNAKSQSSNPSHSSHIRFLSTRAPPGTAGAAAAAAAFLPAAVFAAPAPTPCLMVPMTVRFAGAATAVTFFAAAAPVAAAVRVLTTVEVLPSLASLMPLALRVVRVPATAALCLVVFAVLALTGDAVPAAVAAAPRRVLVVAVAGLLRVEAAARVERAFSTMLLSRVDAVPFVGEAGLPSADLAGEAARGMAREFAVAGDSGWPWRAWDFAVSGLLLPPSVGSGPFSLSPSAK
jgi:hypothetical protein